MGYLLIRCLKKGDMFIVCRSINVLAEKQEKSDFLAKELPHSPSFLFKLHARQFIAVPRSNRNAPSKRSGRSVEKKLLGNVSGAIHDT